jgi:bacterial/archaeal transporter family-2 protein
MFHLPHALTMLAAGVGVPILAALNAQLGQRLGSPALAAAVLFVVAFACALAATLATGTSAADRLLAQPRHLYLGGVLVAFYVLSITYIAPTFGVGNAVFFVLLGQLVSAALIDHFGLMGARPEPISAIRAAGIGLMALDVLLTQRA